MDDEYSNRALLAEATQWPADTRPFGGDGEERHIAFHFPLMPRLSSHIEFLDDVEFPEIGGIPGSLPFTPPASRHP
jgi:maltose alpha-D-glucosyltransferase/alpha-amylase